MYLGQNDWYFVRYIYGPWDDNFHCALMTEESLKNWSERRNRYCEKYKSGNLADKSDFLAYLVTEEEAAVLHKWLFNYENWRTPNFPLYKEELISEDYFI